MRFTKKKKCPKCGKKIINTYGEETFCPYCGESICIEEELDSVFDDNINTRDIILDTDDKNKKGLGLKFFKTFTVILTIISVFSVMMLFTGMPEKSELSDKLQSLQYDYDLLQERYDELESEYNYLEDSTSGYEAQIEELNTELSDLQSQYDDLELENESLKETIGSLESSVKEEFSSGSGGTLQTSSASEDNYEDDYESMVWISETGSKYHNKPNCGNMNPDKAKEVSVSTAESMGLSPCKKCF